MTLYVHYSGEVLFVPTASGVLAAHADCCCDDAPTSCPCDPWPDPTVESGDFPCGGLAWSYSLAQSLVSPYDSASIHWRIEGWVPGPTLSSFSEFRILSGPHTLTATDASCTWEVTGVTIETRAWDIILGIGSWTNQTSSAILQLSLASGVWLVNESYNDFDLWKDTGFPPGIYLDDIADDATIVTNGSVTVT